MVLKNIGLLATPKGKTAKKGVKQGQISLIENAAITIEAGRITYAGPENGLHDGRPETSLTAKALWLRRV